MIHRIDLSNLKLYFLNSAETFMHHKPHICADPSPRNFSTSGDRIPSRNNLRTAFTLACSFIVVTAAHRDSKVKDECSISSARKVTKAAVHRVSEEGRESWPNQKDLPLSKNALTIAVNNWGLLSPHLLWCLFHFSDSFRLTR